MRALAFAVLMVACGGRIAAVADEATIAGRQRTECESTIYLLGMPDAPRAPELLRFSIETLALETVGAIECGGLPREAFALAVDRDVAYVEWVDYATQATNVFRLRLSDAACLSSVRMDRPAFEMTFMPSKGTLFASDSHHLYTVDPASFVPTPLGPLPGSPPLATTPDGSLFALFPTGELAEIDPESARVLHWMPLRAPGTFAFTHWHGEFVLFTETKVHRYADGVLSELTTLPMRIIGAGAATCD